MAYPDSNQPGVGRFYTNDAGASFKWNPTSGVWVPFSHRYPLTWVVAGPVTPSITLPGPCIPLAAGQAVNLIYCRYRIGSGTSQAFKIQRAAAGGAFADIANFGTTASPLSATTTSANSTAGSLAIAADDEFQLVLGAGVGTPNDLRISMMFESVL